MPLLYFMILKNRNIRHRPKCVYFCQFDISKAFDSYAKRIYMEIKLNKSNFYSAEYILVWDLRINIFVKLFPFLDRQG